MRFAEAVLRASLKVHSLWSRSRRLFVPSAPLETARGRGKICMSGLSPSLCSSAEGSREQQQKLHIVGQILLLQTALSHCLYYCGLAVLEARVHGGTGSKQRAIKQLWG